jgi:pimeloyl-ACP methyl ester carboxylesterase
MDENSSIFVDQLVIGKILEEKLSRVHHVPEGDWCGLREPLYKGFSGIPPMAHFEKKEDRFWLMTSPHHAAHGENALVPVLISPAQDPRASVILVHGLYEENREMYGYLIKNLNQCGLSVYQTTLPYHYDRTPATSAFSGEYFWSANIARCRAAMEQGVYELYQLRGSIQSIASLPVYTISFSMGSAIALSLLALTNDIDKVFLINPACSLSAIVWDSPLCRTIKQDLLDAGFSMDQIVSVYASFEPVSLLAGKNIRDKAAIGYGIYDQITSQDLYRGLIASLSMTAVHVYKSGHLNILRVPKLAADINNFFK